MAIGHEPVRLVVIRPSVVETLVTEGSEILQSALVITLSIRSIGKSLAECVVSLEHQPTREPPSNFDLQRMIVRHRVVGQQA